MKLKNLTPSYLLRRLKKEWTIRRETKKRGGPEQRAAERRQRLKTIAIQKATIREDLIRGWSLGEINRPTEKEWEAFFLYYHHLPMSFLIEIKKKYWNVEYIIEPNFHYPA
jgi:hypothetical protein